LVASAFIASLILCPVAFAQDNDDEMSMDYVLRMSGALLTQDRVEVQSMIDRIDQLIASGDRRMSSLHYNKAQLLHRLGRNEEALLAAQQSELSKWYVATLLLRLGREHEGKKVIESLIGDYRVVVADPKNSRVVQAKVLRSIVMASHLAGEDTTTEYRSLIEKYGLPESEKKMLDGWVNTAPAKILEDTWPAAISD
jgi:hypothetical protein